METAAASHVSPHHALEPEAELLDHPSHGLVPDEHQLEHAVHAELVEPAGKRQAYALCAHPAPPRVRLPDDDPELGRLRAPHAVEGGKTHRTALELDDPLAVAALGVDRPLHPAPGVRFRKRLALLRQLLG